MKLRLSLQKKAEEIEKELKDIQFADKDSYSSYKAFDGMEEGDIYIVTKDKSLKGYFLCNLGEKIRRNHPGKTGRCPLCFA